MTGKQIGRREWTAETPPTPRIARLPNGGFVLLHGNRLDVLDSSLVPVSGKTLDLAWSGQTACRGAGCPSRDYDLIVPVQGRLFGIRYFGLRPDTRTTKIIDSQTFAVIDQWDNWFLRELYEDGALAGQDHVPQRKLVGREWQPFGTSLPVRAIGPHFLTANLFAFAFVDAERLQRQCWAETDGASLRGKPICYSELDRIGGFASSQDGSTIAVTTYRPPEGFAALFDLNGTSRTIVYAQGTHRKLLTIPPRQAGAFALSLDGSRLAVLRREKLSLYRVPHP